MHELEIGVDIGGTRTKYGLVNAVSGDLLKSIVQLTEKKDEQLFLMQVDDVVTKFKTVAEQLNNKITGIGFGVPGFTNGGGVVDTTYGFIEFMENYGLKTIIEDQFSLPCLIDILLQ